jgi:hypothetical protein
MFPGEEGLMKSRVLLVYGRAPFPVLRIMGDDLLSEFLYYQMMTCVDMKILNEDGTPIAFLPQSMESRNPLYKQNDPDYCNLMNYNGNDMDFAGCLYYGTSCDERADLTVARMASAYGALGLCAMTLRQLRFALCLAMANFKIDLGRDQGVMTLRERFRVNEASNDQ